jgi:hypothetical protein
VIASGWGEVHYNDNNQSGVAKSQDAWSWRLVGKLTLAAGGKLNFQGHYTCATHDYFTAGSCHTEFNF